MTSPIMIPRLRRRPGFTIAEASLGLILAMAGSAMVVNLAISGLQHASLLDEKFLAQEELTNLKERTFSVGLANCSDEWLAKQTLSRVAQDKLVEAKLNWKKEWINPLTGKVADGVVSEPDKANWPVQMTATLKWKVGKGKEGKEIKGTGREAMASWVLAPKSVKVAPAKTDGPKTGAPKTEAPKSNGGGS